MHALKENVTEIYTHERNYIKSLIKSALQFNSFHTEQPSVRETTFTGFDDNYLQYLIDNDFKKGFKVTTSAFDENSATAQSFIYKSDKMITTALTQNMSFICYTFESGTHQSNTFFIGTL